MGQLLDQDRAVAYTAFASTPHRTEGRLIVRRARERDRTTHDQGELFATYRYHAVFADSPFQLSRPNPSTASTPSSNRSSPTCSAPRPPSLGKIRCQRRLVTNGRDRARIHPRAGRADLHPGMRRPPAPLSALN